MQTDWIVRQISQFAQTLSVILGLRKRRQYEASLEAIGVALDSLLGLSPDALRTLSAAELLVRITLSETVMIGREKCLFVAALLKETGDICTDRGQPEEGTDFYLKALQLLLELRLADDLVAHPGYAPEIETLLDKFDVATLPLETQSALMLYFEQTGAYSRAEDILFEMLDAFAGAPDAVTEIAVMGLAFYERLQRLNDESLIAGNLPRDEVEAGLEEVRQYLTRGTN